MTAAQTAKAIALLACLPAMSCLRPTPSHQPSVFANGIPSSSDSTMTTGPYAGATPRMTCVPDVRELEVGEFVHCTVAVRLLGDRGPTTLQIANKPALRTSTPNVFAITTDGQAVVRGAGAAMLWSTVYGASVITTGYAFPRVASLRLEPFVSDTVVHVGDTLRIRAVALDDSGHEMSVARELKFAWSASPNAGTLARVDSATRWLFVARAPGIAEFNVSRFRRLARLKITIDSAPAKLVVENSQPKNASSAGRQHVKSIPAVGVLVTYGDRDSRLARAGVTLASEGTLSFTDSNGFVRFRDVEPGRRTLQLTCPVSRRIRGREILRETVDVTPTTDTIVAVMIPAGECVEPPDETVRATFVGHYTEGFEAGTFRPCKAFAAPLTSAYETRDATALIVFDNDAVARAVAAWPTDPLHELHPTYFVRWTGTLTGPGSYGHLGTSEYMLRVEHVLEARVATPRDCNR